MEEETFKTTAKHLKVFARAVQKWQTKLGLSRWATFIQHKDDELDGDGDVAWVRCDYESLVCTIGLPETWPIKPTNKLLELAAFHECRHLIMAPLMELIPKNLQKLARQEEHRLIAQDERALFGTSLSEQGVDDA